MVHKIRMYSAFSDATSIRDNPPFPEIGSQAFLSVFGMPKAICRHGTSNFRNTGSQSITRMECRHEIYTLVNCNIIPSPTTPNPSKSNRYFEV